MRILKIFSGFLFLSLLSLAQADNISTSIFKSNPLFLERLSTHLANASHVNSLSQLGGIKDLDGNPIYAQ